MGHDAFDGSFDSSNRKPNIKLHLIIFITIVGVSIFLSTQIEKSKDNIDVEALKTPVSIDSLVANLNGNPPVKKSPGHSKSAVMVAEMVEDTEVEYTFEDGSNLAKIDKMLASNNSDENEPQNNNPVPDSQSNKFAATMVLDEDNLSKRNVETSSKKVTHVAGKLDTVYELQQDRFLETLAKTAANQKTTESFDIKRLREAMRNDQPLESKPQAIANNKPIKKVNDGNQSGLVKVAATNVTGVIDMSAKNSANLKIAKTSTRTTIKKKQDNIVVLTQSELNNVLSQFTTSYNEGDIKRMMALFDENARTNDQHNKLGIKTEYIDLFNNTLIRKIKIKNMQWNLGKSGARGDAKFSVIIQPNGTSKQALYEGNIEITAVKGSQGVFIKSLLHNISSQ